MSGLRAAEVGGSIVHFSHLVDPGGIQLKSKVGQGSWETQGNATPNLVHKGTFHYLPSP